MKINQLNEFQWLCIFLVVAILIHWGWSWLCLPEQAEMLYDIYRWLNYGY